MINVLVIDDNQTVTEFVKASLEELGNYQVMTASSGKDGVARAGYFGPHIIFLDFMLPDMEGPEAAALIRKIPGSSNVPIVFLTGILTQEELHGPEGVIRGEIFVAKPPAVWMN